MVYHLNLIPDLAIHDVFRASLLKVHHGSVPFHPVPIIVADIDTAGYEVEEFLYHCTFEYNNTMKTEYLVKWESSAMH